MDERSNRYLLLITALVIGVLTLAVLAIEQTPIGTAIEKATANWPVGLPVAFNVIVLLAAAVIAVGYFEWGPLMKFLGLGIACKAVLALLTAVGYIFTSKQAAFADHLQEAAFGSLVASVVHAIGVVVLVSWALRDLVMGRQAGIGNPPDGIILPTEDEAELPPPEPSVPEPASSYEAIEAAADDAVVVVEASPREGPGGDIGDEEDLDRVVAAAAPVTADLEALPDQLPDETEREAPEAGQRAETTEPEIETSLPEIDSTGDETEQPEPEPTQLTEMRGDSLRFTVEEILGCFQPEDVVLSAEEVRHERGDEDIRVPFEVVLPQIEEGAVRIDPDIVFTQLPRRAFGRSAEEIKGHLWQGLLELPLDRVIAQVPSRIFAHSYSAEQPAAAEFGDPFTDSLAQAGEGSEPGEAAPVELEEAPAAASPVPAPGEIEPGPKRVDELAAEVPIEGIAAIAPAPHSWPSALPATLRVDAEYIIAQFPSEATAMPIEDIEAKLRPHGKLLVPADDVLMQLAEGYVAIDVTQLLEQLPAGAIAMSWSDLRDALPGGKVRLPLHEIVRQLPRDTLTPELAQHLQDAADGIPEPFHEAAPAGMAPEAPQPQVAEPELAETTAAMPDTASAPAPAAGPAEVLSIAWLELLPQFPPDAFSVGRDQVAAALQGKSARIDMHMVRAQLGEGRVTVPCGYLLAQFPDQYLELSVEQIAERVPEARFELPLVSIILQLPEEELALPTGQVTQEPTDELPTIFIDSMSPARAETEESAEPPALAEAVEETAAAPGEPTPEPGPTGAASGDLTRDDIHEIEDMLDEERRRDPGLDEDSEFVDGVFADEEEEEEAPLLATPVLEPGPAAVEGPSAEEEEPALFEPELETAASDVELAGPATGSSPFAGEEPEPALSESPPVAEAQEAEHAAAPAAEWPTPEGTATRTLFTSVEHEVEAPLEELADVPATGTAEQPTAEVVARTAVDLTPAAQQSDTFRALLHEYARFHIEHGHVAVEGGRLALAFTPAETSAEGLALALPPRLAAFEQLLRHVGCGPLDRAVLTAAMGTIVCQWLPSKAGSTLAMFASTDRQAAGVMHLQVKRDAAALSDLAAQLGSRSGQGTAAQTGATAPAGATPCRVVRPDGGPHSEIARLLAAFDIGTVAELRFSAGTQWMLASSLALDDSAVSGQTCYDPSYLVELPEPLRLGRIESILAVAGDHVVTLNAPERHGEPGLICIFPNEFREGLLRMKADKASAMLCAV